MSLLITRKFPETPLFIFTVQAYAAQMGHAYNPTGQQSNQMELDQTANLLHGLDDDGLCICCMDKPIGIILHPCGHSLMCIECATIVKSGSGLCPTCRAEITTMEQTFDSLMLGHH